MTPLDCLFLYLMENPGEEFSIRYDSIGDEWHTQFTDEDGDFEEGRGETKEDAINALLRIVEY